MNDIEFSKYVDRSIDAIILNEYSYERVQQTILSNKTKAKKRTKKLTERILKDKVFQKWSVDYFGKELKELE